MASIVDICNLSLHHLGERPIVALTDPNERARACNRNYAICRDATFRAVRWKFAAVKAALALVSTITIPGWEYVYAYPSRALFIAKVFDDIENPEPEGLDFDELFVPTLNQKVIVCNSEDAYADYNYQVTDPTLYDPMYVLASSYLLASVNAPSLTGDADRAKTMLQLYQSLISDAARLNNSEKRKKNPESGSIIDSRG